MALTALILVILADDSKIVLPALFAFAFGLVIWSIKNAKNKADKDYVDKKWEENKQYVDEKIRTHEQNEDRVREQLNCTLSNMNQKLDIILDKLIPEQKTKK